MATAIEIKYCKHCGQLENMHSNFDWMHDKNVIKVWCACGAEAPRIVELGATEPYYLDVEVRQEKEETVDADSDSGDIPEGGEARRAGDA